MFEQFNVGHNKFMKLSVVLPGECEVSYQKCSPKTGKSAPPTTYKKVHTKYNISVKRNPTERSKKWKQDLKLLYPI